MDGVELKRVGVCGAVSAFRARPGSHCLVPDTRDGRRCWTPLPFGLESWSCPRANQIQREWATILCELLRGAPSGKPFKLSAMYLEFANTGEIPVTPPYGFSRDENLDYYTSLTGDRDYLRVPIVAQTADSTDETLFPAPRVNRLTSWAVSSGNVGRNGLEFSAEAGSRLYGAALVSTPDPDDPSQDLIYSRFYFPIAEQLRKIDGAQLGIAWPIQFL